MFGYFLARSKDGHDLALRRFELDPRLGPRSQRLPVNSDYLELLSKERGILVRPGVSFHLSDLTIVRDALDEALAGLGHELRSMEGLKRQLLSFSLGLDATPATRDRETHVAGSTESSTAA